MTIATELLELMDEASRFIEIPPIRDIHVPALQPNPSMDAEFGLIVLDDGSTGFFYAWLGDTLERMRAELRRDRVVHESALELATRFSSGDPVERAIGLGAINAISQHLFRRSRYELTLTASSTGLRFADSDHVGMVGLFPSLARRLVRDGVRLTVVERKVEALDAGDGFSVSLDPARLQNCNKVICTASTLLNDTLDEILDHCRGAEQVALIGPSAGCVPDPLFERGIDLVGGSVARDVHRLLDRLHRGESWGDAVSKYTIAQRDYPGATKLLSWISD